MWRSGGWWPSGWGRGGPRGGAGRSWGAGGGGPRVTARLVDPLLGGVYAGRAEEISLAAAVPDLYGQLRAAPRRTARAAPASAGRAARAPARGRRLRGGGGGDRPGCGRAGPLCAAEDGAQPDRGGRRT